MPEIIRSAGDTPAKMPMGPFEARVVSHLDPRRSGDLRVELLSNVTAGNDRGFEPGQLFTVRYCMPFYGVNNVDSNDKNSINAMTNHSPVFPYKLKCIYC